MHVHKGKGKIMAIVHGSCRNLQEGGINPRKKSVYAKRTLDGRILKKIF